MKKLIFFMVVFFLVIPFVQGQDCSPACQPDYTSGVCRNKTTRGFWMDAGFAYLDKYLDYSTNTLTLQTIERLDFAQAMGYDVVYLTFHRAVYNDDGTVRWSHFEEGEYSGILSERGKIAFDLLIDASVERGLKPIIGKDWRMGGSLTDPNYRQFVPDEYGTTMAEKMRVLSKLWTNITETYKGDDRIFAIGAPMGDIARGMCEGKLTNINYECVNNEPWLFYTTPIGAEWWAPLLQIWLDAVWSADPERTVIAPPINDMGVAIIMREDYWRPTGAYDEFGNQLAPLNIWGPLIWEKDAGMRYDEVITPTQYYPYKQNEVWTLEWMNRWNQVVWSESLHGFKPSAPGNSIWEWNEQTLQWLDDWLDQREEDNFPWWWESSGWKRGSVDDVNLETIRTYHASDGTERPFVEVIRNHLTSTTVCQSGEVDIDQDGCSLGETCCCSGVPIPTQCQTLFDRVNKSMGSRCRRPGYDKVADVDNDGRVDLDDQFLVLINFGDEAWCEDRLNDRTNPCRGGCPILKVFDGKEFVTVEKLDIHSPKDQDTVATSTFTMEPIDGKYEIVLDEAAYLFWDGSHIDSVVLTDETGKECELISAEHSNHGDVLSELKESDDVRTRTFSGEEIKLVYEDCSGKEFTFSIEGYNMKLLGIEIPDFVVVLLAIIILIVLFGILKYFVRK